MTGKILHNWSSGKDAALALYRLQKQYPNAKIELLTAVNSRHNRVTMHGLRRELLLQQIDAIGLPFRLLELPENPSMEEYDALLKTSFEEFRQAGGIHVSYGDIYLEDLRVYRDSILKIVELEGLYPLWQEDTTELFHKLLSAGFKTVVICCNEQMGEELLGSELDATFLEDLPKGIDPCGENGEFHTFCYDGPVFKKPVGFQLGEKVLRKYPNPAGEGEVGFWFLDLLPC